jgi:hypothetical protein
VQKRVVEALIPALAQLGLSLQPNEVTKARKQNAWKLSIRLAGKVWRRNIEITFRKRKELREFFRHLGLIEGSDYSFDSHQGGGNNYFRDWIYSVRVKIESFRLLYHRLRTAPI